MATQSVDICNAVCLHVCAYDRKSREPGSSSVQEMDTIRTQRTSWVTRQVLRAMGKLRCVCVCHMPVCSCTKSSTLAGANLMVGIA